VVRARGLKKDYQADGVAQRVLDGIDLDLYRGDFTVVMGASGAGKSTLLYILSGLERPSAGQVELAGESLIGRSETELALFRREHCGFVFQNTHLVETMSGLDNVLAAGLLVDANRAKVAAKAETLFDWLMLPGPITAKFPAQLSGGEAQRVGIVRALINSPAVLFADEPTGALNRASGTAVLDILNAVNRLGQSVVLVTHDLRSARRGNRVVYLSDGQIKGDLELGLYRNDADKERNRNLYSFLIRMGW
jgi:putative ABC transport system ATP-binding protein